MPRRSAVSTDLPPMPPAADGRGPATGKQHPRRPAGACCARIARCSAPVHRCRLRAHRVAAPLRARLPHRIGGERRVRQQSRPIVGLALGTLAATCVSVFFQAALVIAANVRADGGNPTRAQVLGAAWNRRAIFRWSILTTTVGLVLRAIQDRLGAAGAIVGALGGLA